MFDNILPVYNQSNYDLAMQGYGGLDKLITMCKENNIISVDLVQKTSYRFDKAAIVDLDSIGYPYQTEYKTTRVFNPVFNDVFA